MLEIILTLAVINELYSLLDVQFILGVHYASECAIELAFFDVSDGTIETAFIGDYEETLDYLTTLRGQLTAQLMP